PETAPTKAFRAGKAPMAALAMLMVTTAPAVICVMKMHHSSFSAFQDALRYILKTSSVKR
ncbi:MAG: hypothetical protein KJ549_12285, partial [Alphaproteobacteria bacterium]|nr:hypothetical protein [Alphaproteobacteria bacterium]MBU1462486.1 hypothetical protein [Alphaproteobacteria bacterium]